LLEVLEQSGHDDEVEEEADCDHEQRRLDEEPPEALAVWMQQGDPVRLHDGPDEPRQGRCRPEHGDDTSPRRSLGGYFEFGDELCVHDVLPWSRSGARPADAGPQAYAGAGGGLISKASPNRLRGVARAARAARGAQSDGPQ